MKREEVIALLDNIEKDIREKIKIHENSLSKIMYDENNRIFINGCILGLHNALICIPLAQAFLQLL